DPVAAAVEQRVQERADPEPSVRVVAVGRIVGADAEHHAVRIAVTVPIVAAVVAPVAIPPAVVAAPPVIVAPVVAPVAVAVVVPAIVAPVAVAVVVAAIVAPTRVAVVGLPIAAPGPVAVVAAAVVVLRDVAAVAVAVGIGAVALDRPVLRGVDDRPRRRCRATVRLPDLLRLGRALAARVGPLRAPLAGRAHPLAASFHTAALARIGAGAAFAMLLHALRARAALGMGLRGHDRSHKRRADRRPPGILQEFSYRHRGIS